MPSHCLDFDTRASSGHHANSNAAMKRPRPHAPASSSSLTRVRPSQDPDHQKPHPNSIADAAAKAGLQPCPHKHSFFDTLPDDALLLIIYRLSRTTTSCPLSCPLIALASVSPAPRRLIATTIAPRLSFSVYGNPDWFWLWLAIAGPNLRELALHNRSYRTAGDVRHFWPMWPRRPSVQLDPCTALSAIASTRAPLRELDVSGLHPFRRTAITALSSLLGTVRTSLSTLKIDLSHFRVAHAVAQSRLRALKKLVVVNIDAQSENQLLILLQSLPPGSLTDLSLDACEAIPCIFHSRKDEMRNLLSELETLHIDFDDELQSFSLDPATISRNLLAAMTISPFRKIVLSGSGIPVMKSLIDETRLNCPSLTELRLIDCDVMPTERMGADDVTTTIDSMTPLLTQYYPRWVKFNLNQLEALTRCTRLTHIRVFTGPGAEESLMQIGRRLRDSVVDLEVYPKKHEMKRETSTAVVRLVQNLNRLERLCLVTLDLSIVQLKSVLRHCGSRLRFFAFSPPMNPALGPDETATKIAEVFLHASKHLPGLRRLDCIFQNDQPPTVTSAHVARLLSVSLEHLERRAPRLETGNLTALVQKMLGRQEVLEAAY